MNILVVGLGSMGKRRIRLLKGICPNCPVYGVDVSSERREQVEKDFKIKTEATLDMALENFYPDCVIVSSSPLSHSSIIKKCLNKGCHVFSELNLIADDYEVLEKTARTKKKVLFLSSTFLYRKEIEYIDKVVTSSSHKINYTYHVGQYLPDWHPWENIDNYFVSNKRTNGCRELFAIELPWLIKVFGKIVNFKVSKSKNSSLNVNYPDNYMVMLEHENGNKGLFSVDIISRKAVRKLEVYNDELYLSWDGSPHGLFVYDYENKADMKINLYDSVEQNSKYASFIIENAYQSELESFFSEINGIKSSRYSFTDDVVTLNLIDRFEEC